MKNIYPFIIIFLLSFLIQNSANSQIQITSLGTTSCEGDPVELQIDNPGNFTDSSYQWQIGIVSTDTTFEYLNSSDIIYYANISGYYRVLLLDSSNTIIDSSNIIGLTFYPVYTINVDIEICDGESYFVGGAEQSVTGIYTDVLQTVDGCDSTITTNLFVDSAYTTNIDVAICDGESYFVGGADQSISGIYTDVLQTVDGCDSTIITDLIVNTVFTTNLDVEICEGETYFVGGTTQTVSGIYTDLLQTIDGCDSTIITNLIVNSAFTTNINVEICEGESYFVGGADQTTSGIYTDILQSVEGCDSTIITNLIVNQVYTTNLNVAICDGETYFVGGADQIVAGVYNDTLQTIDGCDSTIITNLTVNPVNTTNINAEICEGETYFVAGAYQTISGVYNDTLQTVEGCDSTIITNLTVNPVYTTNINVEICEGETYFVAGAYQTISGVYNDILQTVEGCDSTIITNLTVNPVYTTNINVEICEGETYFVGGADQSDTGAYEDVLTTVKGCDSIIVTNLYVNSLPLLDLGNDTIEICINESITLNPDTNIVFSDYLWSDNSVNNNLIVNDAGTYSVTVTDVNGCINSDSIEIILPELDLGFSNFICFGDSYTLNAGNNGATYLWNTNEVSQEIEITTPGLYSVTVTDSSNCIITDDFMLFYYSTNYADLGPDINICKGEELILNPGAFDSYLWSIGETTQSILVYTSGNYGITVIDANGCESSDAIFVTVDDLPIVDLGSDVSICEGNSINLDAGNLGSEFLWSTSETTQAIDISETGLYSVSVTNSVGCFAEDVFLLIVNQNPTPDVGADTSICESDFVELNSGSFDSYLWSTGETTQSILVYTTGNYGITVIDANGCESSDAIFVTVDDLPILNLGQDASICDGASIVLDAENSGSTYIWSTGDTSQTITINQTGLYSVTVTNISACTAEDDFMLIVNQLPTPDLGSDVSICDGEFVILDPGSFENYLWSDGNTTQSISVDLAGTYSVTVSDVNGCQNSDTIEVTIDDLPIVNLGSDASICEGGSILLDAENYGSQFLWNTGETTQNIETSLAGTYFVSVSDANGCENFDFINISINPLPSIDLGNDWSICEEESIEISANGYFCEYLWNTDETTSSILVNTAGLFSITVTDENSCINSDYIDIQVNVAKDTVLLFEDFSNGIPWQWSVIDFDGLVPNVQVITKIDDAWTIFNDNSNNEIISTSWFDQPNQADDRIITPIIDLSESTNNIISWKGRVFDNNYPDTLEIWMSDNIFLLSNSSNLINEAILLFKGALTNDYDPVPIEHSIETVDYSSVYFLFRNNSTDQYILSIDDIKIEGKTNCLYEIPTQNEQILVKENDIDFNVFPNPANSGITIFYKSDKKQNTNISIYDMLGKCLYNKNKQNITEINEQINISNWKPGIYYITLSNDKRFTKRLIVY